MKINFSVNWVTLIWRFELVRNKIIIDSLEKFLKLKNKVSMFAFVCSSFDADSAQQMSVLSFELKLYKDCFDSKNAEMFFTYENENHVINLKLDKKSSYDLLYALSEKEF